MKRTAFRKVISATKDSVLSMLLSGAITREQREAVLFILLVYTQIKLEQVRRRVEKYSNKRSKNLKKEK